MTTKINTKALGLIYVWDPMIITNKNKNKNMPTKADQTFMRITLLMDRLQDQIKDLGYMIEKERTIIRQQPITFDRMTDWSERISVLEADILSFQKIQNMKSLRQTVINTIHILRNIRTREALLHIVCPSFPCLNEDLVDVILWAANDGNA